MKKLWYLFLTLFLAFGLVACEKEGDIAPDPEPEPVGPTAAPKGVVSDVAFVRDGYQAAELSWTDPKEEFPITGYQIVAKCEGQKNLTYSIEADEIVVVDGKQTYVIEGLEQPEYEVTILVANAFGQQKNGTVFKGVKPFTLESMTMPTVAITEKDEAMYLRFTNVNGSRNIFDHLTLTMKDAEGNVIFEGEAAADEDALAAALEDKTVANEPIDVLIELAEGVTLDDKATYSVDYTIYAHAAIGGVIEEGAYVYEEVLDMLDEPASKEGKAENLGVGVEVQPLFFHFYSYGSSYLTDLNQAVITVPQIWSKGVDGQEPEALYREYRIYTGTSEDDYALYVDEDGKDGIYAFDDERWEEVEDLNVAEVSELAPNADKSKNLYANVWIGQAIPTIALVHEEYPSYIRVEAYDAYGRMVAMGQRLVPVFSVEASQPDIQAHQPKWELLPNNDGVTFTLKASHLSAARAYARKVEWTIKDEAGEVVASDVVEGGSYKSVGGDLRHCATLTTKEWKVAAKNFIVGKKYTVDYTIDYIPVYHIPGQDAQQPLDYDPETGKFTPTPDGVVANATGMDHDVRILRDYSRDEEGNVMFRTQSTDENEKTIFTYHAEKGDYRGWIAWGDKSVVLTSEELVEAGATLQNELSVPEENGEAEAYKASLKLTALKRLNAVNVSWNAFAAEDITKVIINDGTEDIEVTADGEYAWTESDGRASIDIEGIVGGPDASFKVDVYAGDEVLASAEDMVSIFTLDNWQAPVFEWVRLQDGRYKFVAKNLANVNYAFSHNIYEDIANSEKKQSVVRLYDSNNQLVQTLYATSIIDWWFHDWSCYARWQLSMQDAWDEWVWVGNHDSKGQNEREVSESAILAGEYRVEYEFGYVVNKNGFWSTTDAGQPNEVASRPDVTVYPQACVAFPPQVQGAFKNNNRNENVLYCENRCQQDLPQDDNFGVRQMVKVFVRTGEGQFSVNASTDPEVLAFADVDEGTERIDTQYSDYVGLMSKNGLFEAAKVSWQIRNIPQYDKVVVAYGDKSVEVTDGSSSTVISGLKTSPVEFTVTVYNGSEAVASNKVSTDVYVLPTESLVEFDVTYNKDKFGWNINMPKGLSTPYYGTWIAKFNVYKKGETTAVFAADITKNGKEEIITFKKWMARGYIDYHMTNNDWEVADADKWDATNKLFKGLEFATDYEIRYELSVYPMIYNADNAGNTETKFYHKKMLMNSEAANGTQTLTGTFEFTTPAAPAELAPIATAEGYQGAKIQWNAITGATGYEVYVGDKKVAEAAADATSAAVTGLTDARKYIFTVKALGTDSVAQTAETEIYTLCDYNPNFEIVKQDDGSWKLNMYKLAYEGGIFRSIAFTIKEKGSDTVLYSENGTDGEVGYIADGSHFGWANALATNWVNQTDGRWSTAEGQKLAGVEFKHNTTYVVEYTAALTPGIVAWTAADYKGSWTYKPDLLAAGTAFYYKSLFRRDNDIPTTTGTMEFTTAKDPTVLLVTAETVQEWQAAQVSWNAITGATGYEVYVGDNKVAEAGADATSVKVTGLTGVTKCAFTVKALGVDKSGTSAETYVFTDAGWEAPVVKFTKADGGYQMTVSNMLHESFGYFSGKIVLKDGTGAEKYVFDHSFPAGTVWMWTCWRRVSKGAYERSDWKMNGSTAEAKVFDIAPGTYTVEYSINYTAFKDSVWGNGAGNYGKDPINPTTKDAATYLIFNNFENDILWETRGAANGQGANGTGAMPYLFNKVGTFTGTYTIE